MTNLMYGLRELGCLGSAGFIAGATQLYLVLSLTHMKCAWRNDSTSSHCITQKYGSQEYVTLEAKLIFRKQIQEVGKQEETIYLTKKEEMK